MRVVIILSVVAAIAAEAPYHLPQPGPQAPVFNLPVQQPQNPPHFILNSQQQSSSGYNYQQPQPAPLPLVPQPQPILQPAPQPLPQPITLQQRPQPLPQPLPSYGLPQPQPIYPQPQPNYPQPQPIAPQPFPVAQPSYALPQPQPQPIYLQPQPQPSYSYQQQPSYNYPQPQPIQPLPQPLPIQPLPQPQPQQPSGYSYQQPAAPLLQPIQNGLSSYQADSNQYNNAQLLSAGSSQLNSPQQQLTHREALDDHVVSRVQSIIKDSEHSSARDNGYLSLVSGVSLGNAQPSIEISSFVQNSQLQSASGQSFGQSASSGASQGSALTLSSGYDAPGPASVDSSIAFLPQNKPAISYGVPN